ncbi:uncharacterized protein PGTG_04921 [Puccinia graminis f. sp. tritici CRL 75-36-700-3]|uniref:Uncharacterized protein n=1 Tax=Puccinia graminis f. sp. tritici (strain CRL 75-36-700-3 / race SCCL) TaxID=418459 RepID=E3K3A8_PUCGT|nr:uncharacterized protein PGTG_04921 [Puccinia graminis f. sp. tritici CRL 75-36-700-3]EFP78965.1 hypothetical protein PGTG_04921 [Puccinia graminis f. sp. tritici CRL 75-36-700-3]
MPSLGLLAQAYYYHSSSILHHKAPPARWEQRRKGLIRRDRQPDNETEIVKIKSNVLHRKPAAQVANAQQQPHRHTNKLWSIRTPPRRSVRKGTLDVVLPCQVCCSGCKSPRTPEPLVKSRKHYNIQRHHREFIATGFSVTN